MSTHDKSEGYVALDASDVDCMCTFDDECSGTGVVHCSPPCGGDLCICVCGGEGPCDGCDACEEPVLFGDLEGP